MLKEKYTTVAIPSPISSKKTSTVALTLAHTERLLVHRFGFGMIALSRKLGIMAKLNIDFHYAARNVKTPRQTEHFLFTLANTLQSHDIRLHIICISIIHERLNKDTKGMKEPFDVANIFMMLLITPKGSNFVSLLLNLI